MTKPLLVYANVPFCNSKCHFCDWVVQVPTRELRLTPETPGRTRYLDAVAEQVAAHAPGLRADGYEPRIVYWGGGTASILDIDEIRRLHGAITAELDLSGVVEATIEGSPESLSRAKLDVLRSLGFNRISIGVQSFADDRLRMIGRSHSADEAVRAVGEAAEAGFDNINIDLIVGFPDEDLAEVEDTVRRALTLPVNHFSVYPYRASPGTVLRKQVDRGNTSLNVERQLRAYRLAADLLTGAGHPEYAMSYFGGPHCLSDEAYYQLKMDWIGFGAGANSLVRQRYLATTKGRLARFNDNPTAFDVDVPAGSDNLVKHFLAQALTTREGVDARLFQERTGVSLRRACERPDVHAYLERMAKYGDLVVDGTGIRLTPETMARTYVALSWIDLPTPEVIADTA
ncbi:radical SAM family heme chaperone HemW [Saccharothrix violaceirubra]|uniref:Heme chaperone HemW n=1 Tax=Saccharothrix violaceirubra TaxID=413306 RepID=A0A7W7T4X2_9PSEU|nr:coproporphyrinogen-III oxidase family protein [Saccharothrix violaceirubra]MBB4966658.1 oxygen-independent coproporphyrinogen-3 oxidase [Saccharothrix violaceirubra]